MPVAIRAITRWQDADELVGLSPAADRLPYFDGADSAALATFTSFGRSLVAVADASEGRTTLGLGSIATAAETNYLLAAGTRMLSGDWDIGSGRKINADAIWARSSSGLALYDDGGSGLFIEDGGFVGIGTTNPATILDIYQNQNSLSQVTIKNDNAGASSRAALVIESDASKIAFFEMVSQAFSAVSAWQGAGVMGTNSSQAWWISAYTSGADIVFQAGSYVASAEKMRIDGTTSFVTMGAGGAFTAGAQLHVKQTSTTAAVPVLLLDQADISEEMIEFTAAVGTGNAIEAVGAKSLTTTHFIKATITGVGTVYIPCGTIA